MKLIDLLSVISENATVEVKDEDGNELGRYNGKDNITTNFNEKEVLEVSPYFMNSFLRLAGYFDDIPFIEIKVK